MKIKYPLIVWILFYIFLFIFILHNSSSILDPDLGWHLRVGQDIVSEKAVPSLEHYDYTLEGKQWVDHEWLANLLSYLFFKNFGYISLSIIFSLFVILSFSLLHLIVKKYYLSENARSDGWIMFLQFFGIMTILPHIGVRMQVITFLFLVLLLFILAHFNSKKKLGFLFWLLPLFYFWANLHGGFLIGIFVVGLWWLIKFFEFIINKYWQQKFIDKGRLLDQRSIIFSFIIFLFSVSLTLFTPYGFKLYYFLFDYTHAAYMKIISEWLPIYSLPINYFQFLYSALAVTILFIFIYKNFSTRKFLSQSFDLFGLIAFCVFFYLSASSHRHFPLFFVVTFPLLVYAMNEILIVPDNWRLFFSRSKIINFYFITAIILIIIYFSANLKLTNDPFRSDQYCDLYPCRAVDFIKSNSYRDLKIFDYYGWGGYLIYEWPDKKLFIDGRLPQYKYNEHTLIEEYMDFFDLNKLPVKLEQHNIQLVLIKKPEDGKFNWLEKLLQLNRSYSKNDTDEGRMIQYFDKTQEWKKIFEDQISVVYVKR